MAWNVRRTEHCGAKNGGGHWGSRRDAKDGSKRRRREADKALLRSIYREDALERPSAVNER